MIPIINKFNQIPDRIGLVFGYNYYHGEKLVTLPFIHGDWITQSGFWLLPYFCADYVNTWLNDVAKMINRYYYLPEVVTEHMHVSVRKNLHDQNHYDRLNMKRKERPDIIYSNTVHEIRLHANKYSL